MVEIPGGGFSVGEANTARFRPGGDRSHKILKNREIVVVATAGLLEMWMLLFGGFFGGGVMGLPPGERDAAFVQCPPKDVILYSEWAARGKGKAGAAGIEGFAADPEVLAFIAAIDKAVHDTIEINATQGRGEDPRREHPPSGQTFLEPAGLRVSRRGCEIGNEADGRVPRNSRRLRRGFLECFPRPRPR